MHTHLDSVALKFPKYLSAYQSQGEGFRQVKNNLIISKELHVPRPTVQIVVQVTEEFNHLTKI